MPALSPELLTAAADLLIKGAVVLLLAGGIARLQRRASAAARHRLWAVALLAVLALPLLSLVLPAWRLAILPAGEGVAIPATPAALEERAATPIALDAPKPTTEPAASAAPPVVAAPSASLVETLRQWPWVQLVLGVWAFGALALALRLVFSTLAARRLVAQSTAITEGDLVQEIQTLGRRLGLKAAVTVVEHPAITMPMAWGIRTATVLLPRGAQRWNRERRQVVLLHELAHIRRRDCATMLVARLVTALHWPNPLAWYALRRLQTEREHACDDLVLHSGTAGSDYAHHLLETARALRSRLEPRWATVAMARPSELEGRLLAILDPDLDRRPAPRAALFGVLAIILLVLPLAALQPRAAKDPATGVEGPRRGLIDGDSRAALPAKASHKVKGDRPGDREAATSHSAASASHPEAATLPVLIRALEEEGDAAIREQAAWGLGMSESEAALPALLAALADPAPRVRRQAAWGLGMIESTRATSSLRRALRDDDAGVRQQAAWALGMIENPEAVADLRRALLDDAPQVRQQTAWALGMIESEAAGSDLRRALSDPDAEVRQQVAWALGMIEHGGATADLATVLAGDESPEVREQAAWALGMIEDPAALDALLEAMSDDHPEVRQRAFWAVGHITH